MFLLNCKGHLHSFSTPVVMGIVNTTPDSFFTSSRGQTVDAVVSKVEQMLEDGAQMIDMGGQSTRPGSTRVTEEEEKSRVLPAIEAIAKRLPQTFISIDTYYAGVAREAVWRGAGLVNDVSAGTIDEALLPTVAELQVPYVLMHMKGTLDTLQTPPPYENLLTEVFDFFSFRLRQLHDMGIYDVLLDPGFGFGKTIEQNFELLKHLSYFKQLEKPLLIGLSRKGTIHKTLQVTAAEALNGTTVLNTIALLNGASILRVHDVKEAVEAIKLTRATSK